MLSQIRLNSLQEEPGPDSGIFAAPRQEFNQRKNRKGAFWEDRYHATAIESGEHLLTCLVYIDLNMVRAGVVHRPSEWPFCGYNEIQKPKKKEGHKSLVRCAHNWNSGILE